MIHQVILDELIYGIFKRSSRKKYIEVIHKLKKNGCDAVILGCTEIPLLIRQKDSPLPVLDSTRLLAIEALKFSLMEEK